MLLTKGLTQISWQTIQIHHGRSPPSSVPSSHSVMVNCQSTFRVRRLTRAASWPIKCFALPLSHPARPASRWTVTPEGRDVSTERSSSGTDRMALLPVLGVRSALLHHTHIQALTRELPSRGLPSYSSCFGTFRTEVIHVIITHSNHRLVWHGARQLAVPRVVLQCGRCLFETIAGQSHRHSSLVNDSPK